MNFCGFNYFTFLIRDFRGRVLLFVAQNLAADCLLAISLIIHQVESTLLNLRTAELYNLLSVAVTGQHSLKKPITLLPLQAKARFRKLRTTQIGTSVPAFQASRKALFPQRALCCVQNTVELATKPLEMMTNEILDTL